MIKIADKRYEKYEIKIKWYKICRVLKGKKIEGFAPFLQFNIEDKIFIGLETSIVKEAYDKIELDVKTDANCFLTDITYEDELGWVSIIDEKHSCYITKKSQDLIKLDFEMYSKELKSTIAIDCLIDMT